MKNVKKFFIIFLLIFGIIISTSGCSFAGGVPKYNPKDPNPKPGLYYVGETKYLPGPATILKDGRVLIIERNSKQNVGYNYSHLEIFDPSTGKFTTIKEFPYYLNLLTPSNHPQHAIVLDDGRVLFNAGVISQETYPKKKNAELYQIYNPENNSFSILGRSSMCRSYPRHGDQIYPYYTNIIPYIMTNLKDGKIASYCNMIKTEEMEIVDIKNNTISKPIKKGDKDYITPPEKYPRTTFKYQDLVNSYIQLYPEFNDNFLFFGQHKLTENRYLIISNREVDYGIRVSEVTNSKEDNSSWFCPLYEYNIDTKELIKKNEYLRSSTGLMYPLKGTNKLIIIGGRIPNVFPQINQNAVPNAITLRDRVLYSPRWAKATKKIYIYVY